MALLSLQYPNGRRHLEAVGRTFCCGDEFVLYGRVWRVVRRESLRRPLRYHEEHSVVVCEPVTASPLLDRGHGRLAEPS